MLNRMLVAAFALLFSCGLSGQSCSLAEPDAQGMYCFNAYAPWLPVGASLNAEINLRNPKTADTLGVSVSYNIMHFYLKGGMADPRPVGALIRVDGQPPIISGFLAVTLNPGEKRDIQVLDVCYGDFIEFCNDTVHSDLNPSVAAWIQVRAKSQAALAVQLLQFQDFAPDGSPLTMDKFRRDYELSWEWQGPIVQTPVGRDDINPRRQNAITFMNVSKEPAVVQFDLIDELGRVYKTMTTLDLPETNLCPRTVPALGSCGFLVVGRSDVLDSAGNPMEDFIGLFPSTTVLPKMFSMDGNFRGTLRITTPGHTPLAVSGYTYRGDPNHGGGEGTLVFEPMPHR